jgi:hypothetical protein
MLLDFNYLKNKYNLKINGILHIGAHFGEEFKIESTSVPYWDENCGVKFINFDDLNDSFIYFMANKDKFKPREYIINNLTLEICAKHITSELNK